MRARPQPERRQKFVSACFSSLVCSSYSRAGSDQPLLAVIVHGVHKHLEALVHEVALDLASRRDRLALFLWIERLGKDAKVLDLLGSGKLAVRSFDLSADQPHHVSVGGKPGAAGIRNVGTAR